MFQKLLFFSPLLGFILRPIASTRTLALVILMVPLKSETKDLFKSANYTKVYSLEAAIFQTMAYKMSLEINQGTLTFPTKRSFLKVLYNVCQITKNRFSFEQFCRIHVEGPKIAICETSSATVLILNSAFTTKDNYFQVALDEAIDAFNATLTDFGYTQ